MRYDPNWKGATASPGGLTDPASVPYAPARPGFVSLADPRATGEEEWSRLTHSPLRKLGFHLALAFIFLRFSFLHEIITSSLHVNPYLLLIVGAPTTLVAILAGALQRTFRAWSARFVALFLIWMAISVPFSAWKSDSALMLLNYIRATLPVMFIIAGITLTVAECFLVMQTIALGCAVNVLYAATFSTDISRLDMGTGSITSSNDFAAHLLFVLPFVLCVALTSRAKIFRIAALLLFLAGIFVGAKTGSRGAMLGISAAILFAVFISKGLGTRVAILMGIPLLAAGLLLFLPETLKHRYTTVFSDNRTESAGSAVPQLDDAVGSTRAREYLLKTSIAMTLQHPLLGVGPGEFLISEGGAAQQRGEHGQWQVTHNTYTQVSSEEGIPGLIFFVAALLRAFRGLYSVYRECREPQWRSARLAALCLMLTIVGFGTAIFFLSLAYSMYVPAIVGLSIAWERAVLRGRQSAAKSGEPVSLRSLYRSPFPRRAVS